MGGGYLFESVIDKFIARKIPPGLRESGKVERPVSNETTPDRPRTESCGKG